MIHRWDSHQFPGRTFPGKTVARRLGVDWLPRGATVTDRRRQILVYLGCALILEWNAYCGLIIATAFCSSSWWMKGGGLSNLVSFVSSRQLYEKWIFLCYLLYCMIQGLVVRRCPKLVESDSFYMAVQHGTKWTVQYFWPSFISACFFPLAAASLM